MVSMFLARLARVWEQLFTSPRSLVPSLDIYTLPGQVNLATGSNVGNGFDSGEAQCV